MTNIGHNCGKNHFHIEFDQLSKAFERDIALHTYSENIGSTLIVLELYRERMADARVGAQGADELYKKGQLLIKRTSGCPEAALSIISKMIQNRSPNLLKNREASEKEIDDLEAIQGNELPRPYYMEEKVGELHGLSFLYAENDLRSLMIIDLEEGLKRLTELDVDNGEFKELKYWSSWCSDIDRKIENVLSLLESGRRLLNEANLLQISQLIADPKQRRSYVEFIRKKI